MLGFLKTKGFNSVVERETILTTVRSASIDVLVALDFTKWEVECSEEVLQAAANNTKVGLRLLQLLSRKDASLEITEAVLTAAAKNYNQVVQVLQFLWR
jgi:hypothetical protein